MAEEGKAPCTKFNYEAVQAKMKKYEELCVSRLDKTRPAVARIDGRCFTKFTRRAEKPIDSRIHDALIRAAQDAIEEFGAVTAYVQSDEISLILAPCVEENQQWIFNGKVLKMCTTMASFVAIRFATHLDARLAVDATDLDVGFIKEVKRYRHHFDARCHNVANDSEIWDYVQWRASNTHSNALRLVARARGISAKQLDCKRNGDVMRMLRERGIVWGDESEPLRFGTLVKKEKYEHVAINKRTGEPERTNRTRTRGQQVIIANQDKTIMQNVLMSKYWPENDE